MLLEKSLPPLPCVQFRAARICGEKSTEHKSTKLLWNTLPTELENMHLD